MMTLVHLVLRFGCPASVRGPYVCGPGVSSPHGAVWVSAPQGFPQITTVVPGGRVVRYPPKDGSGVEIVRPDGSGCSNLRNLARGDPSLWRGLWPGCGCAPQACGRGG